jgi:ribonuclease HI
VRGGDADRRTSERARKAPDHRGAANGERTKGLLAPEGEREGARGELYPRRSAMMRGVTVGTDGACQPNPGRGGWAAVVVQGGTVLRELTGHFRWTTNNRMELRAAIAALEALPEGSEVEVLSDSQYVVHGATAWSLKWERNGWRKTPNAREEVMNADLWRRLRAAMARHRVASFTWVKGHAGHPLNERCNALAEVIASGASVVPEEEDAAYTGGPR